MCFVWVCCFLKGFFRSFGIAVVFLARGSLFVLFVRTSGQRIDGLRRTSRDKVSCRGHSHVASSGIEGCRSICPRRAWSDHAGVRIARGLDCDCRDRRDRSFGRQPEHVLHRYDRRAEQGLVVVGIGSLSGSESVSESFG